MNILTDINPVIVSVFAGLMIGAFVLILFSKRLTGWIIGKWSTPQVAQAPAPALAPAPRPTLTGLSWIIATTHRSVSQLIGLIMSFASLIAIVLSVICAVGGITLIVYQQYGNLTLTLAAAVATSILALLIENASINALKTIRLANEEIAQAEQAHNAQIVKQMEEQFEEDAQAFAKINHQTLTKEEVQSMQRAASLKQQARKQFEKKRRGLMREQTRTARHNRRASIPFAVIGILFSATAGGLFWHTLLASLALWINITVGTMFALAVSVTFVQSELLKRIKDDAIAEALRSGEMQNVMLKQQSEEMVLEMVVDTMASVKQDPNTLIEMGTGIKEELKTTIRTLTKQTTSRLVEDTGSHGDVTSNEVSQNVPEVEPKTDTKRQKKEPEWFAQMEQSMIPLRYPRLRQKLDSLRSASRVTISIVSLMDALNCSKKFIHYRIKSGALQVATHNNNLIRISSVIDWLQTADIPTKETIYSEKTHETVEISNDHNPDQSLSDDAQLNQDDHVPSESDGNWKEKLSITLEAMRTNPAITEEELAAKLGMKALGIVRFWKIKAREMLEQEQRPSERIQDLLTRASTPKYSDIKSSSVSQNGHVG
jgi:hypothetical protein